MDKASIGQLAKDVAASAKVKAEAHKATTLDDVLIAVKAVAAQATEQGKRIAALEGGKTAVKTAKTPKAEAKEATPWQTANAILAPYRGEGVDDSGNRKALGLARDVTLRSGKVVHTFRGKVRQLSAARQFILDALVRGETPTAHDA